MKFMIRVAVLFYAAAILLLSGIIFMIVLNLVPIEELYYNLGFIYSDFQIRLVLTISALVMLFLNYVFMKVLSGDEQKGKTIAFDNPSGRVSVSLSAMEDLVRRVISGVQEVKEVRSAITAGKKGLQIEAKIVLNADVNIPEMTSRLQDVVTRKVQDTIGIEEKVVVRVHVAKIIPATKGRKRKEKEEEAEEEPSEPTVPFQGYRA